MGWLIKKYPQFSGEDFLVEEITELLFDLDLRLIVRITGEGLAGKLFTVNRLPRRNSEVVECPDLSSRRSFLDQWNA